MCFPDQNHLILLLKTIEIVKYKRRPILMAYPLLEDALETASLVIDWFDVYARHNIFDNLNIFWVYFFGGTAVESSSKDQQRPL